MIVVKESVSGEKEGFAEIIYLYESSAALCGSYEPQLAPWSERLRSLVRTSPSSPLV